MVSIEKQIKTNLFSLAESPDFIKWYNSENPKNAGGLVIINNSFFFRKRLDTTKNRNYLCLSIQEDGALADAEVAIATNLPINSDYKFIPLKSNNVPSIKSLSQAIEDEIDSIGKLLFILIGKVDDNVQHSEHISHELFSTLTLNSRVSENVTIKNKEIVIRELVDEQELWNELTLKSIEAGVIADKFPDSFLESFTLALEALSKKSYSILVLPDGKRKISTGTLIDKIKDSLELQASEYKVSLKKSNGDSAKSPIEFNNILRIAYNFSSDATTLLRLITRVCMQNVK